MVADQHSRLQFCVLSRSGEDPDHPARELLRHNRGTRGWQSPRFCSYPQELVLRLDARSRLHQLQLLAHEYKIPTRVEVFVGDDDASGDSGGPPWRRLGFLSFDANERSGHQARELKSVHVTVDARLVRLVVHRCHVNRLNIYNQVGLVAVNLTGEPPAATEQRLPLSVTFCDDDSCVDVATGACLAKLERLKATAVATEDFDEAKRLKDAIARLRALGARLAQLEARKAAAVAAEDFDLAKALRDDLARLRGLVAVADDGGGAPTNFNEQLAEELQLQPHKQQLQPQQLQQQEQQQRQPEATPVAASYDERPAVARGDAASLDVEDRVPTARHPPVDEAEFLAVAAPLPAGWPSELPAPEPLASASAADAEPVLRLGGEYVAAAFFSQHWQLRSAAASWLADTVDRTRPAGGGGGSDSVRALARLVASRGLRDRVPQVCLSCLRLLQAVFSSLAAAGGGRDVAQALDASLPALLERLADGNARVRSAAHETLVSLARQQHEGCAALRAVANSTLCRLPKSQAAWRPVLATVTLLRDLLPLVGVDHDGFALPSIFAYAGAAFDSPSAEVRAAAVQLAYEAAVLSGAPTVTVRKLVPRDTNPKVVAQLDALLLQQHGGQQASKVGATQPGRQTAAHDEAAALEAELAAREAALGSNHPAVAEAASALAACCAARGDSAAALTMYERALAAAEAAHGPQHREVGHALTDLAVLHLEAGRDAVGRPLLQRALAIQRVALGPDHPDVLAIQDVLATASST